MKSHKLFYFIFFKCTTASEACRLCFASYCGSYTNLCFHGHGEILQLLYLAFITPVVYDFYNYDIEKPEFVQLFNRFAQVWLNPDNQHQLNISLQK